MATKGFCHEGRIVELREGGVRVAFDAVASCEGCRAKDYCGEGARGTRFLDVCTDGKYEVGEKVRVSVSHELGALAIVLCYVLPLVVFVLTVVLGSIFLSQEGLVALVAFLILALYYIGIYALRHKLSTKMRFEIETSC